MLPIPTHDDMRLNKTFKEQNKRHDKTREMDLLQTGRGWGAGGGKGKENDERCRVHQDDAIIMSGKHG